MSDTAPRTDPAGPARKWTGRARGGLVGNWIFVVLLRYLGLRAAYVLLAPVAAYYLLASGAARRASAEYLHRIGCGGRTFWSRAANIYRHFYSFGRILLDRVAIIIGRSRRFRFELDGEEHLRTALQQGKGLVLVSAHCGNWEAAAHVLRGRLEAPVSVVAYEGEARHMRRFFDRVLRDRQFSLISSDGSAECSLAILSALSRGGIVAMHGDRALGSRGQEVDFLGARARFPDGPYLVAAVSGAPVIHAFAMRQGTYRYRFRAYPPEQIALPARNQRNQAMTHWVGLFAQRLERELREFPYQWHNFYDFWGSDDMPGKEASK